jgi:lipoprotein NlpI
VELAKNNPYNPLWLYLARVRGGRDNQETRDELAGHVKRLNLPSWPGPLYGVYLSNVTSAAALALASDADPTRHRQQLCEGYFFLGQHAVIRGDRDDAFRMLKSAAATCSPISRDYMSTLVELKRLGGR